MNNDLKGLTKKLTILGNTVKDIEREKTRRAGWESEWDGFESMKVVGDVLVEDVFIQPEPEVILLEWKEEGEGEISQTAQHVDKKGSKKLRTPRLARNNLPSRFKTDMIPDGRRKKEKPKAGKRTRSTREQTDVAAGKRTRSTRSQTDVAAGKRTRSTRAQTDVVPEKKPKKPKRTKK